MPPNEKDEAGLFVYGTLRPEGSRWPILEPLAARHRPATASGDLYDTGLGFPAARFGGEGVVVGDLVTLHSLDEAVRVLDEVEGVERGLFERVRVEVRSGGEIDEVWSYAYLPPVEGLEPIPDGDWLQR